MEIYLNNGKVKITSDASNFVINKRIEKKDGTFEYRAESYYANFEFLVNELVDWQLMRSEATSLEKLSEDIKKIKSDILEAFNKITK